MITTQLATSRKRKTTIEKYETAKNQPTDEEMLQFRAVPAVVPMKSSLSGEITCININVVMRIKTKLSSNFS